MTAIETVVRQQDGLRLNGGLIQQLGFQACLLEVAIGGKRFCEASPLHDYKGETIRQAPVLVGTAPVENDRGIIEVMLK
jgi:hypothetical protein